MSKSASFDEIIQWRRSVRLYNGQLPFDEKVVDLSLSRALLAPTSSNMQLFEIYRVKSPDKKRELATLCLSQPAATSASELVVFAVRRDKWSERAKFNLDTLAKNAGPNPSKPQQQSMLYYSKAMPLVYKTDPFGLWGAVKKALVTLTGFMRPVYRQVSLTDNRITAHKSCALVAQTFMLSLAAEGYDSCPMEGLDTSRVKRFLGLPCGAEINMVIAVGLRKEEGVYGPRLRLEREKLIFEL